ncbi:hypothetical protein BDB00DRAFT_839692 [Zychaea mexicana]|uniref:uncharacterized protein n=1 Tax=Zychaea mexicana TaxID=64656 RepID=UPI0022FF2D76|nr:uncharacterized protein BDB00DRAFT_839692 [Zychaea mexicana]KAI9490123.1 hypothetical protein BDB00DRAFT_839692 [Zychaea mexicana]
MSPTQAPSTTPTPDTSFTITVAGTDAVAASPLAQSDVYLSYLPVIVICVASLYISVYILRCIYWHYRRRRKRQLWLERGRLRLLWMEATARHEEKQQQSEKTTYQDLPANSMSPQPPPPASTVMSSKVLPRPASYPSHSNPSSLTTIPFSNITSGSSTSSSYSYILTTPGSTVSKSHASPVIGSTSTAARGGPRPHSVMGTTSARSTCFNSATTLAASSTSSQTPASLSQQCHSVLSKTNISNTIATASKSTAAMKKWRYRTQNKKRRRWLIWQWSVAMGYCRYSHASRLEHVVQQLQQAREQQHQDGTKEKDERASPSTSTSSPASIIT